MSVPQVLSSYLPLGTFFAGERRQRAGDSFIAILLDRNGYLTRTYMHRERHGSVKYQEQNIVWLSRDQRLAIWEESIVWLKDADGELRRIVSGIFREQARNLNVQWIDLKERKKQREIAVASKQ